MKKRKVLEKVGGLDESYFLYCEDMDWCRRMNLQGYDVCYFLNAIMEYEGTRSARHSWKYAHSFYTLFIVTGENMEFITNGM